MPVVKLTARNVTTLSPQDGASRADFVDALLPGFVLRVTASGVRTFVVRYFRDGKARRYTIGRTPPLSLADARDIARRLLAAVTRGSDPQAEKLAERRQRAQRTQTFGSLCERFLFEAKTKDNLPLRQTTLYNWRNIAKVEILPAFGDRVPEEITRRDVRGLVEAIADQRPYWANRVFELVRRVFSWAVEKDLIVASPCVGLKKPGGEKPRDRVLSSEEIRSIWSALDAEAHFGDAVRLLFYTAARPREVLNARWTEFDLDGVEFQLRDVRRTVRTRLREMGAPQDVSEAILSHARPKLIRTYDRYQPVPEMRAALEAWSTRLEFIVTGPARADVVRLESA